MSAENSPHIAQNWRLRGPRLRLEGSNCQHCGRPHFPQRIICPDCGKDNRIAPKTEGSDNLKPLTNHLPVTPS